MCVCLCVCEGERDRDTKREKGDRGRQRKGGFSVELEGHTQYTEVQTITLEVLYAIPKQLNTELPYNSGIPLLIIHPKEEKAGT